MRRISLHFTRDRVVPLCALVFFAGCLALTALREPEPVQQAFVTGLMLSTVIVLLCVFGRFASALVVGGGLFVALRFISELKERYLESQLMPSDFIYYASTSLVDTLRHYPHLYGLGIGICVVVPPLLYLVWRWDWRMLAGLRRRPALGVRVGGVALGVFAFWLCMLPGGPFARVHSRNVWEKMSDDAQLTNFFINFRDSAVTLPAMASDAVAEQQWGSTAAGEPVTAPPYPDIVQVLEESTFDPSNYTVCTVPACHLTMFQADARTRGTGVLRTHTFGGGTWVSEFATLTGMPQDIFGAGGMYAPFVLAPRLRDSLPLLLKRLGYQTIAVYPVAGNFLNARNAYKAYGFDKFYDARDLGLKVWHTSDAQMFAAAKKVYDENKKPGQPVFMMILTLEQHGPHDTRPLKELPAPFNQGLLPKLPAGQELNLSAYLSRLQDSDKGMDQLEQDFLHRPQPTVLMHFGDHQPSFGGLIRSMPRTLPPALEPYKNNLTYFMLKSNFAGPAPSDYPMLDIAFLPAMVLQAAGLPEDPYFSALGSMETRCRGLYEDCPDKPLLKSYYAWTFEQLHVFQ